MHNCKYNSASSLQHLVSKLLSLKHSYAYFVKKKKKQKLFFLYATCHFVRMKKSLFKITSNDGVLIFKWNLVVRSYYALQFVRHTGILCLTNQKNNCIMFEHFAKMASQNASHTYTFLQLQPFSKLSQLVCPLKSHQPNYCSTNDVLFLTRGQSERGTTVWLFRPYWQIDKVTLKTAM